MSELITTPRIDRRLQLLGTASALALLAMIPAAQAADSNRPTVWIEGGWHFEDVMGDADLFTPPLDAENRAAGLPSLTDIENTLGHTYGGEGSISFQPQGSDWVFSASARYGRVQTVRRIVAAEPLVGSPMKQFAFVSGAIGFETVTPTYTLYADNSFKNTESHVIADFQVGKDIGIGLFGHGTDSLISFGVRYAQMNAASKGHTYANPYARFVQGDVSFGSIHKYYIKTPNHRSSAFMERTDSFQALGPTLSIKNTTGLLGTVEEGQLALDWGVNAALLFGRQKAKTSHHSTVRYFPSVDALPTIQTNPPVTRTRSRMVTVPNVGGFAALSYRFTNAKISAGYRADFFFGAKDSGLETRTTADVGFHGPFATISFGLGG